MKKSGGKYLTGLLLGGVIVITGANLWLEWQNQQPLPVEERVVKKTYGWFFPQQAVAQGKTPEASEGMEIAAQAAVVIDAQSKQVLLEKNSDELLYPASSTKMITALVAKENYPAGSSFLISEADLSDGNTLGLGVGEKIGLETLLQGLLISSDNQAAAILANHYPGGREAFVTAMNQKALELGMSASYFDNPQGYDGANHQVTARDLSLAAWEVMRDEDLQKIVATESSGVINDYGETYSFANTNQLLGLNSNGWRVEGIKTGTTPLGGEVLVSWAEKNGVELLIVVMGAENRYNETVKITEFVENNYQWRERELWP